MNGIETLDTTGRFWAFGGPFYYAAGGMHDFIGSFATLDEAKRAADATQKCFWDETRFMSIYEWWQVLDSETGQIVAQSKYQSYGAE